MTDTPPELETGPATMALLRDTQADLAAVREELATANKDSRELADAIGKLTLELAKVRVENAALRKYAWHERGCNAAVYAAICTGEKPPCTCGLEAALAGGDNKVVEAARPEIVQLEAAARNDMANAKAVCGGDGQGCETMSGYYENNTKRKWQKCSRCPMDVIGETIDALARLDGGGSLS